MVSRCKNSDVLEVQRRDDAPIPRGIKLLAVEERADIVNGDPVCAGRGCDLN